MKFKIKLKASKFVQSVCGQFNMRNLNVYLNLRRSLPWNQRVGVKWLITSAFAIFSITMHSDLYFRFLYVNVNATNYATVLNNLLLEKYIVEYLGLLSNFLFLKCRREAIFSTLVTRKSVRKIQNMEAQIVQMQTDMKEAELNSCLGCK